MWAAHVVHHSSEQYNQTTALRQSVLQGYFSWVFYLPFAPFIPPQMFLVHKHFNLLYQYWIHTELVGKLGPLEYILNTPSHHRVHHGSNLYCIDKNYGGTLIIWDRLFGTFQEEVLGTVVYGITHPINTFDPIVIQTHHLVHIFEKIRNTPGFLNKIYCLIKGPGWTPGTPRLGNIEDIPMVNRPTPVYNPPVHLSIQAYNMIQFVASLIVYLQVMTQIDTLPTILIFGGSFFVLLSCTCFGKFFDRNPWAFPLEYFRLTIALAANLAMIANLDNSLPALIPSEITANQDLYHNFLYGSCVFYLLSMAFLGWRLQLKEPFGKFNGTPRSYMDKKLRIELKGKKE